MNMRRCIEVMVLAVDAELMLLPRPRDGVPILRPGKNGIYPVFTKQARKAAIRLFMDLGRISTDDLYNVPPVLDLADIDLN